MADISAIAAAAAAVAAACLRSFFSYLTSFGCENFRPLFSHHIANALQYLEIVVPISRIAFIILHCIGNIVKSIK